MKKLEFRGSRYELHCIVKALNGVMVADDRFHCVQKIQGVSKPTGISFRFDCAISESRSGFTVGYRVYPTIGTLFTPALLLLVLAGCFVVSAAYGESWLYSVILSIFLIVSLATLLICRQKCTRRFLHAFKKQSTKKKRS